MEEKLKLFRVTLKGLHSTNCGISYVIDYSLDSAYEKVKTYLNSNDIGFNKDRELDKIELIATTYMYNNTGCMLFV